MLGGRCGCCWRVGISHQQQAKIHTPLAGRASKTQARCECAYVADAVKTAENKSHLPQLWLVGWLFPRLRLGLRNLFPLVPPVGPLTALLGRLTMREEKSGVISVRLAEVFLRDLPFFFFM